MASKCICPPRMRDRIVVEQATSTNSATGEPTETWVKYWSGSAEARAMRTSEVIQSEQVQGQIGWMLTMRRRAKTLAITSDMRVRLKTQGNRIVYADGPSMPLGTDRRFVQLRAMERTQ